jgi:hypothetical protein
MPDVLKRWWFWVIAILVLLFVYVFSQTLVPTR